jgi:hypothetical protein
MYAGQVLEPALYMVLCLLVVASVWWVKRSALRPRERLGFHYLLFAQAFARAFLFGLAILLDFLGLQAEASKDLLDDIPGLALFSVFCVAGYLWVEMVDAVSGGVKRASTFVKATVSANVCMYLIYSGLVFWAHLAPKSAPNVGPVPFNQSAELVIDAFFIVLLFAVISLFALLSYWLSPVLRIEFPTMNRRLIASLTICVVCMLYRVAVLLGAMIRGLPGSLSISGLDASWVNVAVVAYYAVGEVVPSVLLLLLNIQLPSASHFSDEGLSLLRDASRVARLPANSESFLMVDIAELDFGRVIAQGTFGVVHEGRWRGMKVACKKLSVPFHRTSPSVAREFLLEIEMMSRLRHPNIVQFLCGTAPPAVCLVTEFMEGGNLRHALARPDVRPIWNPTSQLRVATEVTLALNYLHLSDIVHRDLSPNNVLLGSLTDLRPVKLCDFGLSRFKTAARSTTRAVGTPAYISPEIYEGGDWSPQSDVFSLAFIIWELYTFQEPFADKETAQIMYIILKGERLPFEPGIRVEVRQMIERCWQAAPQDRPSTGQILTRLQDLQASARPGDMMAPV